MWLTRMFRDVETPHHVVRALLFGVVVALVAYVLMTKVPVFREDRYVLNKAVLLGLLVSELTVFSASEKIPSVVLITFFLFMYFFGMAEVE
jgi:hypothetical protein